MRTLFSRELGSSSERGLVFSLLRLTNCFEILQNRLPEFDFCSHYAELVTRIRRARFAKETRASMDGLTHTLELEDAIPLLRSMLSLLRDDRVLLSIKGSKGMGIIGAAASWWFPDLVQIFSEEVIIWRCKSSAPRCTIRITVGGDTDWWREWSIETLSSLLPRHVATASGFDRLCPRGVLSYPVSGFARGALRSFGFLEGAEIDRACALVATIAYRMAEKMEVGYTHHLVSKRFLDLLGSPLTSSQCISESLTVTCGVQPLTPGANPLDPYKEPEDLVHVSDMSWRRRFIDLLVLNVLSCCLIDFDFDPRLRMDYLYTAGRTAIDLAFFDLINDRRRLISLESLYQHIGCMLGVSWSDQASLLGSSKFGICMYLPLAFWPEFQNYGFARVRVSQGTFIHNGRYFKELKSHLQRPPSEPLDPDPITVGTKLDLDIASPAYEYRLSVRENIDFLVITIKIVDRSSRRRIVDVGNAVREAAFARWVGPCSHPRQTSLDQEYTDRRIFRASLVTVPTSIPSDGIRVVPVQEDHEACLYACDTKQSVVVADGCCVNCALASSKNLSSSLTILKFNGSRVELSTKFPFFSNMFLILLSLLCFHPYCFL